MARAALTNSDFRRINVGSSAGVRTVDTVVAEVGLTPPSEIAEAGRDRTEELEDHLGFAELGAGLAECGCRACGFGETCRWIGAGVDEADEVDILVASSAPRIRMLGIGASSGEMVVIVSSKMVVGVSGSILGLPFSSRGANPERLAWLKAWVNVV